MSNRPGKPVNGRFNFLAAVLPARSSSSNKTGVEKLRANQEIAQGNLRLGGFAFGFEPVNKEKLKF